MRKYILYITLIIFSMSVQAQQMTPEEEAKLKREINEIKWKEDAVFAEIVDYLSDDSDKAVTQAQQQSMLKLQTVVVELFAQNLNMKKEDVQEIWDTIEDKCQNIEIRSGDVIRVFRYIPKALLTLRNSEVNLESNKNKKKQKELDEYFGKVPTVEQNPTPMAPEQLAETESEPKGEQEVSSIIAEVNEKVNEDDSEVVAQNAAESTPIEETKKEEIVETEPEIEEENLEAHQNTTPADSVKAMEAGLVATAPGITPIVEPTTEVVTPELCKTMLTYEDQTSLVSFLQSEALYEKLIFGGYRSMRRPSDCYIAIIDKSTRKIVTILDKGVSERMNFVTKKMDNFENYREGGKYAAIFVQEN